jgi:hypothetical protein
MIFKVESLRGSKRAGAENGSKRALSANRQATVETWAVPTSIYGYTDLLLYSE